MISLHLQHCQAPAWLTIRPSSPLPPLQNFKTPLGLRISAVLKHLFPVPKDDSRRVVTLSNDADFISFRHHVWEKAPGAGDELRPKDVVLREVGPRFELHPFKVQLGTLDQPDAETEWVLRPYMNTARSRRAL